MTLTLHNAVAVLGHRLGRPPARGYTCTRHHVGRLSPGDLWRPDPERPPQTVTAVNRQPGRIVLRDQYGHIYLYPSDGVIPTAVPDARLPALPVRHGSGAALGA